MDIAAAKAWLSEHGGCEHFKYVRFLDNEYAFSPIGVADHADLADGHPVLSAGIIKIYVTCCSIGDRSIALKKSYDAHDLKALPKLFGIRLEY